MPLAYHGVENLIVNMKPHIAHGIRTVECGVGRVRFKSALSAAVEAVVSCYTTSYDPLAIGQASRGRKCHVLVKQNLTVPWLQNWSANCHQKC